MTWFKRDEEINWFNPDQKEEIMTFLSEKISSHIILKNKIYM